MRQVADAFDISPAREELRTPFRQIFYDDLFSVIGVRLHDQAEQDAMFFFVKAAGDPICAKKEVWIENPMDVKVKEGIEAGTIHRGALSFLPVLSDYKDIAL